MRNEIHLNDKCPSHTDVNPLEHAAPSSVNGNGDCMYKGGQLMQRTPHQ